MSVPTRTLGPPAPSPSCCTTRWRQLGEIGTLAREAEIDAVLAKPFAYEDLAEVVRRFLHTDHVKKS